MLADMSIKAEVWLPYRSSAVAVAGEKLHQPIVCIVGYIQEGKIIKQGRM